MTSWLHPRPLQLVTRVLRASLDSGVWEVLVVRTRRIATLAMFRLRHAVRAQSDAAAWWRNGFALDIAGVAMNGRPCS